MKVTYEEIKVHLDLLQGSSIQSKRWMIETYLLLAPAEIALAINTNDDIESLIKEYFGIPHFWRDIILNS